MYLFHVTIQTWSADMHCCANFLQVFRNHGWDGKTPDANATDPPGHRLNAPAATSLGEYDEDLGDWVTPGDTTGDLGHDDSRCMPAEAPDGPASPSPAPHHHSHHHGCGKHGKKDAHHHHHDSKGHHKDDHHGHTHSHGHNHHHSWLNQQQEEEDDSAAAAGKASLGGWRWWLRAQQPAPVQQQEQQQRWSDEALTIVEM
jgi:hypothetical protein